MAKTNWLPVCNVWWKVRQWTREVLGTLNCHRTWRSYSAGGMCLLHHAMSMTATAAIHCLLFLLASFPVSTANCWKRTTWGKKKLGWWRLGTRLLICHMIVLSYVFSWRHLQVLGLRKSVLLSRNRYNPIPWNVYYTVLTWVAWSMHLCYFVLWRDLLVASQLPLGGAHNVM